MGGEKKQQKSTTTSTDTEAVVVPERAEGVAGAVKKYEEQVAQNGDKIPTSDVHQILKQYSGKNIIKYPFKKIPWKGFEIEIAVSLSLVTGKKVKTEEGFKGPEAKFTPEIRSQYDAKKGALAGVIKTSAFNAISGNTQFLESGNFGKIYGGFKLFAEGPEASLNPAEQKFKLASAKLRGLGRWELLSGATADLYIDVAIAPKTEAAMKLLKKGLEKAAKPLKVSKGKALQKAMMEALEAEKREALEKLSKLRSQQDDVIKKYINDAIKKGDREALKKLGLSNNKAKALIKNGVVDSLDDLAKVKGIDVGKLKNAKFFSDEATKRYINEAIKRGDEEALRKLKGIGKGRAKAMIKNGPIDSLKDLKKIKGIKGKVLEQIKSSDIGNKAAKELQEQAAKLTDDIAKVASKEALEVFEKEAAKKAGKRTVRKVASAAAKKLGLKVGAKIAGRILLKFIPFVNIAMILWDIYEIGSLIYKAYKAYNNPNQGGSSGGGDSEEGGETGSEQESAGKEPENTTEGRQAPAQAGISSAAMQKLAEAPAPVRKIWESLTVMGGEATLTDEHLMRFLALIPKNISEQDADKLIEKMKEDPASDPETVFQKLQMSMENLQKEKNAANNKPNVVKPKPKPNEGTEEETTNQVDKAAGGGGKKADSDTRPAVHVEAKDATYNGPSGGERVGSVEVINASWNHTKGNEVTISIAAWHYESDTPVVVHNIPAKVVKRMFMKDDKAVSTRKEANRFQIRYQLYSHGVKFEFPNGVSGTVGVNREVSGSIEL